MSNRLPLSSGGALAHCCGILLIGFACAVFPASVWATTYEVATTGNDANSGQSGSPFRTIQKAATIVAPGDTVLIAPGTYSERVSISRSGTASAPIVFKNAAAQRPTIDGAGMPKVANTALVTILDASYVHLSGLQLKNSPLWGVHVVGSSTNVRLAGLDVSQCGANGIFIQTSTPNRNYTVVAQSKVHDNTGGGIAVWLAPGGYFLVEENEVWNNHGEGNYDGIQVGGGDGATHHVVVRNNISYGNGGDWGADQIDFGGHAFGHHYLAEGNEARAPGGSMKVQQGFGGYAIVARRNRLTGVGFGTYEYPNPAVYYNNTIVNAPHAFQFWSDRADGPPGRSFGGLEVRNNLMLQSTNYLFLLNGVQGFRIDNRYSSIRFANNMYKFTGKGILWLPRIFDTNNPDPAGAVEFAAYQAANAPDFQDVGSRWITSALTSVFVDPTARDYHLAPGSPAIDAGAPLTKTTSAGSSATVIPLVRSDYFQDGYGGLIPADTVQVGNNAAVRIASVDEQAKTITVVSPISWNAGDAVTLPYNGAAPDVGAFESGSDLQSPTLLSVEPVS